MANAAAYSFADQQHFFLQVGKSNFAVLDFKQATCELGAGYSYQLRILSAQVCRDKLSLNSSIQLHIDDGIDSAVVHGTLANVRAFRHKQYYGYDINLVSPLQQLARQPASRTFLEQSIQQISQSLLTPFKQALTFTWQLQKAYPAIPYLAQFQESDWDFLRRQIICLGH